MDKDREMARQLAQKVKQAGGRAYFAGGCVRDGLRGVESRDLDLEIHGLAPEKLEKILDSLGQRLQMGESFGIYQLKGCGLDIALPRTASGEAHRDPKACADPFCGEENAARRRDLTVNAMMQDVLTGEILDHFGGRQDLECRVLRHVDPATFAEDPVRVLRTARFAARFGFSVAEETVQLCRGLSLNGLPRERIMAEVEKTLAEAEKPSVFFETLRRMDRLSEWFPELKDLIGVPQNPVHHAEGDVWTHTMMVLDAAAGLAQEAADRRGLLMSALTHDMGKPLCTEEINGVIHAYGHETRGLRPAEKFLRRLTGEKELIRYVLNMTLLHMKPNVLAGCRSSVKSTNKMFDQAVCPEDLLLLARADGLGKLPRSDDPENREFLRQRLELYREYMSRPCVTGRDLIREGVEPGAGFSEYLAYAHKLHLSGVDRDSALKQVMAMVRRDRKRKSEVVLKNALSS